MKSDAIQTIERELPRLTPEEHLWLIERLAQDLRLRRSRAEFATAMEAMANDPQIQEEIRRINDEFSVADEDGLEGL